jgi:Ca2+-binding EF-hand superfamily protein
MKFFALIATVAAVRLQARDEIDTIFNQVDTSGDGEIQPRELRRALIDYANAEGHTITRADRRWVRRAARRADADGSRSLDSAEFRRFALAFARHYGIAEAQIQDASVEQVLRHIFNMVDTSNNGRIDADELETALRDFAAQENYTITPADEAWVEQAAGRADGNGDEELNFQEFVRFATAFARHYGIAGQ